jgi:hypothetical protein
MATAAPEPDEETPMADKASFTPEEWQLVLSSPMLAGMAVTLGDPSGLWGTMKEGLVAANALLTAGRDAGATALARAIAEDLDTPEGRAIARDKLKADLVGKAPDVLRAQLLASLKRVGQILAAKAPDEAGPFKEWLQGIARNVAETAKEDAFLGFGGVRVSEREKATLAEIAVALG